MELIKKITAPVATLVALFVPVLAFAQDAQSAMAPAGGGDIWLWVLEAVIFGVTGIVLLIGAYYLWELITPYSVKEQLIKEKNMAAAVVVAAFIIGTAIVIAAAITPVG